MGEIRQQLCGEEELKKLDETVKCFKRMSMKRFYENWDLDLYTLKNHLVDHMLEHLQRFWMLSVLGNSSYERFIVNNKQAYRRTFHRSQPKAVEAVNVIEWGYDRVFPAEKQDIDRWLRQRDEIIWQLGRTEPHCVRDVNTIRTDEIARAASESV